MIEEIVSVLEEKVEELKVDIIENICLIDMNVVLSFVDFLKVVVEYFKFYIE